MTTLKPYSTLKGNRIKVRYPTGVGGKTDLPLRFSSGKTYLETGPRVSSFSMFVFRSLTYASSFLITSVTLEHQFVGI